MTTQSVGPGPAQIPVKQPIPASVIKEITFWLANITLTPSWSWNQIANHSDTDFFSPFGTPVVEPIGGTLISQGFYPWGGQVNIQTTIPGYGPVVESYLHLSKLSPYSPGQAVPQGGAIGNSGSVPPGYGNGDIVHYELTTGTLPPYTSRYQPSNDPTQTSHPISGTTPVEILKSVLSGQITGQTSGDSSSGGGSQAPNCFNLPLGQSICIPDWIWRWWTQPIRLAKLVSGVMLMGAGLLIFIMPVGLPTAAAATTALAGAPEAAPAVFSAVYSVTHGRKRGQMRQAPPPASQTIPNAAVSVQRSYTTRRLQARTQPGTGYAIQSPPAKAKPTAPIAQTPPAAPKLGGTPNPMSAEEIAKAQGKAVPGVAAFSQRFPAPKRSPATGLTDTYTLGAHTVMTNSPIPDAEVLQTKEDTRKFFDFQQGQKVNEEERKKRAKMTPEETRKALGISGTPTPKGKVPGTEVTLESEQAMLNVFQSMLKREESSTAQGFEVDPKVAEGLKRDIASIQARIKKMQGG